MYRWNKNINGNRVFLPHFHKIASETSFLRQLSTEKLSDLQEKPYLCRLTYHTSIICNVNLNKTQP